MQNRLRLVDAAAVAATQTAAYRIFKHFALMYLPEDIKAHAFEFIHIVDGDTPFEWMWRPKHQDIFPDESDVSVELFNAAVSAHHSKVSDWLLANGATYNDFVMLD